ncbi:MAG: PEP-CTERM sorting domain-containing protein [Phycisphaerae bacterium]
MKRFAAPVVLLLASVSMASGATLYSDNFESDAVGSPPAGWSSGSADTVLTVVDDGTGNHVMDVNETSPASSRPLVIPISSVTLADGDSLTLSFDLRGVTDPAAITAGDRQFRFAISNSKGTSATTDDMGYIGRMDVGTPAVTTFDLSGPRAGTAGIFVVSGSAKHTNSPQFTDTVLDDNLVHTITVTLQRSGDNVLGSASFTTGTTTETLDTFTDTNALSNNSYTFDEFAIGYNSQGNLEYTLDNVSLVSTVAVPEPASLGLLGVAGVGLVMRRRRV